MPIYRLNHADFIIFKGKLKMNMSVNQLFYLLATIKLKIKR